MGWMRHPRTTQERRANGKRNRLVIGDYVVKLRPSRNMIHLTDTYDDPWRRDGMNRSWKRHRKNQWRRITNMSVTDLSDILSEVSHGHTEHLDVAEESAPEGTNPGDDPGT